MHLQGLNASTARGRWGKWYMTAITKVAEDNCSGLREALPVLESESLKLRSSLRTLPYRDLP